ncbi:MAG TPA: response regulator transcription factor [Longimicrobiales bacterium]
MSTVLIIEDNPDLAFGLVNNLEIDGHHVELVQDGAQGLERARTLRPDLVILDLMLPGLNGYEVLKRLREAGMQTPVLILSARSEEADKLRGFRYGADDYVTKPFSLLEMLARVDALLRRGRANGSTAQTGAVRRFGDVEVDTATHSVRKAGAEVALSPKAYELLAALLELDGKVVSRSDLLKRVWGFRTAVMSRTVDTHIVELRRKLEDDPANPRHILTIRKTGYRLQV